MYKRREREWEGRRREHILEEDDGHGVVQNTLTKDEGVQLGVDVEGVEDGEHSDGVSGRDEGSKHQTVDGINVHIGHIGDASGDNSPEQESHDKGGDRGPNKGVHQNGSKVLEEVFL